MGSIVKIYEIYDIYDIYIIIYLCLWFAVIGLCFGSLINVVIYRLPKGIFLKSSRSVCPSCGEKLSWRDLVPLVSYIALRGRCRYCKESVSLRYPLIEGACGLMAVVCCLSFGASLRAVLVFLILSVLLAIAFIDADTMTIPDSLNIILALLAVASLFVFENNILNNILENIIGFFAISLPMLILALIVPGAFGGGDIKLMAICGFMLGWKPVLAAFFIAVLTGGIYSVYLLAHGKRKMHIAFGPYLCAGVAVSIFLGRDIIDMYLSLFMQ